MITAGNDYTVGLKADGTVVAVGLNDDGRCDVDVWKLFNSIETLEQEREEAKRLETERKAYRRLSLETEKSRLQAELANLKSLFAGIRRKEIETRLKKIEAELHNL